MRPVTGSNWLARGRKFAMMYWAAGSSIFAGIWLPVNVAPPLMGSLIVKGLLLFPVPARSEEKSPPLSPAPGAEPTHCEAETEAPQLLNGTTILFLKFG